MPGNYTRRRDLFADADFADADQAVASVLADARELGILPPAGATAPLAELLARAERQAEREMPDPIRCILGASVPWLFERGGDLTTLLWLCRTLIGCREADVHPGRVIFALAARLGAAGLESEAVALIRFMVDIDFDFGHLYREPGIAYEFFEARDPNPFVWKLLDYIDRRAERMGQEAIRDLRVLELGCGIGNDALGLVSHPRTASYCGVDLSREALAAHRERLGPNDRKGPRPDHRLIEGDFVTVLREHDFEGLNVIYSYSSLHYFNSEEVREIFALVRRALEPGRGMFCFAVKGAGSVWDGQGVPLYRPDVWINFDGQSRWFPSREAVESTTDRYGFELLMHQWQEHWGYSERGKRDLFHYVVCTPRG